MKILKREMFLTVVCLLTGVVAGATTTNDSSSIVDSKSIQLSVFMDEAGHEKNADTITKRQTNVAKLYFMTIADQSFDFSFTMNGGTSSFQNNKEGGFAAFNEFLNEQRHQILRNSVSSIKWYVNGKNQGWTQNNYETGSNASGTLKKLLDAVSELRQVYGSEKNINLNVVAFGCGATRGKIFLNKIPVERKGSASIRLNKAVFYDLVPCNQER